MNYFEAVKSKSYSKGAEPLERDPALLNAVLEEQGGPLEKDALKVDAMYKKWVDTLFGGFNIVVQGPGSKFELLETFKARYLDCKELADLNCLNPQNGNAYLKMLTIKFHGFNPVTYEDLCYRLFEIQTERRITDEDISRFIKHSRTTRTHYVFLMHSFDQFYLNSRKVCDLIARLYKEEPQYMHILLSTDHINAGSILSRLQIQLRLIYYLVPWGGSFFHEKAHCIGVINDDDDINARLFDERLDLQSVKDVYQALQVTAQKIFVYILENSLTSDEPMSVDNLFKYCNGEFIVRRKAQMKSHLGELKDHRIIELDERENSIKCLVSRSNAKKFLELNKEN